MPAYVPLKSLWDIIVLNIVRLLFVSSIIKILALLIFLLLVLL